MMSSCMEDVDFVTETTYIGHVVDRNNEPQKNKEISIGYCTNNTEQFSEYYYIPTYSTLTDATGAFSITFNYQTAGTYYKHYLAIATRRYNYDDPIYHTLPLVYGQETYDFGVIVVE